MKRILILGMDGYLGWSLAVHLAAKGDYAIYGVDNFSRRQWVSEVGSQSAIPILPMNDRLLEINRMYNGNIKFQYGNLCDHNIAYEAVRRSSPDVIVHFAEMPSAPFSMRSNFHAIMSQYNNIATTINILYSMKLYAPDAHLIKLGTMGEYGTPNVPIPEGFFDMVVDGRKDTLPFPRQAGSWYHQSKVHDSNNIMFACKIWELKSTDIMQGVVYGTSVDGMESESLKTRFDFDGDFGTAINRFVAQAIIGHPITPYGNGGQKRGFLPIRDSMQCITLAIENPPRRDEYRVFNQFEETYMISALAGKVAKVASEFNLKPKVVCIKNPRVEQEDHFYQPEHKKLLELGYKPNHNMEDVLKEMFLDLLPYKKRIEDVTEVLMPNVYWDGKIKRIKI